MTELRAFVGHSFNPEDKLVVDSFLDIFDKIKNLNNENP